MDPVSARVQELVDQTGLSQKEFAHKLDLNPAIISHILSGRNKPSLAVIQAITNVYTNVNLNYLLRGEGALFKEAAPSPPSAETSTPATGSLDFQQMEGVRRVDPPVGSPLPQADAGAKPMASSPDEGEKAESAVAKETSNEEKQAPYQREPATTAGKAEGKKIERVIIFYTDHSLEEYRP